MIVVQEVTKKFDDNIALDKVSLGVPKGSITGLIGSNGAGKSTLMKLLTGLIAQESGRIIIDGYKLEAKSLRKIRNKIGYVPQNTALYTELSGYENLSYFASVLGLRSDDLHSEIERVVNLVNLQDHIKKRVANYSGGMQKRLNLAVGLLGNPPILFLDEPTVGVDPQTRNAILNLLFDLQDKYNSTILFASHYLEEVEKICDRLIILDKGHVIAGDETVSILESFKSVDIVLANPLKLPNSEYDNQTRITFPYQKLRDIMPQLLSNLNDNEIINIQYGSGTLDKYIEKLSQKKSL